MDRGKFSDGSPGRLVEVKTPLRDWAFIPDELPPKWCFDGRLWPLLADARELLGKLDGIGQTLPIPDLLVVPLQSREAISSSVMEGTYVTPQELLLYEMDPKVPQTPNDKRSEWREVFNYCQALREGCAALNTGPINGAVIRMLHSTLMSNTRAYDDRPGKFRNTQVQIGHSARFVPPPCHEVQPLMDNLSDYINNDFGDVPSLVKAFITHYQFECIHPFEDGNGRVGRVLLSLMIYKSFNHTHPWLYLSPYFEKYKDEYIDRLFRISTNDAWADWVEFCLYAVIAQCRDSIQRIKLFLKCRELYHAAVESPSARTHQIIEDLFCSPFVKVSDLARRLGVAYMTARSDVDRLVQAGILTDLEVDGPKVFGAGQVFQIAFRDDVWSIDLGD